MFVHFAFLPSLFRLSPFGSEEKVFALLHLRRMLPMTATVKKAWGWVGSCSLNNLEIITNYFISSMVMTLSVQNHGLSGSSRGMRFKLKFQRTEHASRRGREFGARPKEGAFGRPSIEWRRPHLTSAAESRHKYLALNYLRKITHVCC